jgi:hypothetical protein
MANLVDVAGVEGRSTTACEAAPLTRSEVRGTGVLTRSAAGVAAPLGGAGVRACFSGRLPVEFAGLGDIGSPLDYVKRTLIRGSSLQQVNATLLAIAFGTAQNDSRFFKLAE